MFPCVPINKEWKAIVYTETNFELVKELVGQDIQELKNNHCKFLIVDTISGRESIHKDDVILIDNDGDIITMTYDEFSKIFKSNVDG